MNLKKLGERVFNILIAAFGGFIGLLIYNSLLDANLISLNIIQNQPIIKYAIPILFALIFFILSPFIKQYIKDLIKAIEEELLKRSTNELVLGTFGLIIGLIIAFFIGQLTSSLMLGIIGSFLSLIVYIVFPYLGLSLALKNSNQLISIIDRKNRQNESTSIDKKNSNVKILDTSVIIDGRIEQLSETGFLEGDLLLPIFVLEELQAIADSSNNLKRARGRRGLDVVNLLKLSDKVNLQTTNRDFEDIDEVDSKLIKLALETEGSILTTDYNLNKVASVQDINVLNINELANALKPIAIPGESMQVAIIKNGQESGQGLAYLDDGTMIVVDKGEPFIGEKIDVIVSSVLQTNAGKMIFADIKD